MCKFVLICLIVSIIQLLKLSETATIQDCSGSPKEYQVGTQNVTWSQASVLCQQIGMELASINSASEDEAIQAVLAAYQTGVGTRNGFWISGTRNGACNSEFVWFSGGRPVVYRNFAPGQPDNAGGVEACLEIFLEQSPGKYSWNDFPCDGDVVLGFVCQTKCCN